MRKTLHRSWARMRRSVHNIIHSPASSKSSLPLNQRKPNLRFWSRSNTSDTSQHSALTHSAILALFAREILANPRAIGAACPSSNKLGRAMAHPVSEQKKEGLILELGAGTGSITAALLKYGIAPERLIVLERSKPLAELLRKRFPHLRVIEGDAAHLKTLLGHQAKKVNTVVSSLPLRSLPNNLVRTILRQVDEILGESGLMVQFTYDLRGKSCRCQDKFFIRTSSTIVWQNFPPARVDTFQPRVAQRPGSEPTAIDNELS